MRFLFVDYIESSINGKYISGYKTITKDTGYFYENDGKVCFLPSLVGEALGQLAALNVMATLDFAKRPVAGIASKVNIYKPVYLGDKIFLEAFIDTLDNDCVQYHAKAQVDNVLVFEIDNALGPLLPMEDFVDKTSIIEYYHSMYTAPNLCTKEDSSNLPCDLFFSPFFDYDTFTFDSLNAHISGTIPANLICFKDHFPKKPVLPMTLLIANIIDVTTYMLLQAYPEKKFTLDSIRKIKMNQFISPKDSINCKLFIKLDNEKLDLVHAQCILNDKRICVLDILLKEI